MTDDHPHEQRPPIPPPPSPNANLEEGAAEWVMAGSMAANAAAQVYQALKPPPPPPPPPPPEPPMIELPPGVDRE